MSVTKTKRGFDCLAFKDQVQLEFYEHIKDFSLEGQIAFFRQKAEGGPLGDWWRMVKREQAVRQGLVEASQ